MKEKLAKLIDVKSGITFAVMGTLCVLAIRQNVQISPETFSLIVGSIVTYFFTKKDGDTK